MFKTIGITGINTFTKDQFFNHGKVITPLIQLLKPEHEIVTTDQPGGVDLWVRLQRDKYGHSFERLTHKGNVAAKLLVNLSDVVFFFWDGKHKGIQRSIELCKSLGKPYWVTEVHSKNLPPSSFRHKDLDNDPEGLTT